MHIVPDRVKQGSTNIIQNMDDWRRVHLSSMSDPDTFWLGITNELIDWQTPPTKVLQVPFIALLITKFHGLQMAN